MHKYGWKDVLKVEYIDPHKRELIIMFSQKVKHFIE